MRLVIHFAVFLSTIGALTATVQAMSAYTWSYRPLVVFAESETGPLLAEQRRIVASQRAGFRERDMVVVWVVGSQVSTEFGPPPNSTASALRGRYDVPDGAFRAILVGKDGGVKLSGATPLSAETLFTTIDAMPMRRDEMGQR